MSNKLAVTGLVLSGLFVSSTVLAATQAVFPTQASIEASSGDTVGFTVKYSSSSPQDTTGLGLKLYYDSSKLTLLSVSDVFAKDKIAQSDGDDTSNGVDTTPPTITALVDVTVEARANKTIVTASTASDLGSRR